MNKHKMSFVITLLMVLLFAVSPGPAWCATYGWEGLADFGYVTDYNLFLTGDLRYQNSDVEGRAAIGGNARLSSFSVGLKADPSEYSLVVGGNLRAGGRGDSSGGQVNNGGILAGGNVRLERVGLPQGDVRAGKNMKLKSLTVENGDVEANGNVRVSSAYVAGEVTSGRNVRLNSSTVGSISASRNVKLKKSAVLGSVEAGGRVRAVESGIKGDVTAGGKVKLKASGVDGNVNAHASVSDSVLHHQDVELFDFSSVDLGGLSDALLQESMSFVNLEAGQVNVLEAQSGTNYFKVLADEIMAASGLVINAPSDAVVIINVDGGRRVDMHDMAFSLAGGIGTDNVIYNFPDARRMKLHNLALCGSMLAPNAHVSFYDGALEGILMAESLYGGEKDPFDGIFHSVQINMAKKAVPIPGTLILLAPGLAALCYYRRRLFGC